VTADLAAPRRTSPLGAVVELLSAERLRDLVPAVVIAASLGRFAVVVGLGALVAVVTSVASWWRRLWSFDGAVLSLDEGLLVRNQRRIPVERIQHVELERRLRHQLLGLAAVRVETAGGSGAELRLDAVTLAEAHALRVALLGARDQAVALPGWDEARHGPVPPPVPPPTEVLVRLPPSRLLLAGVTGPEVAAVLASLAFGLDAAADLGVDPDAIDPGTVERLSLAVVLLVGVPAWLAVAALVGLVRRWDLTATLRGGELRVTYGLLRRRELVLRTDRVQDARVSERLLLRPFGRAELRLRSAASGRGEASRVEVPLLSAEEVDHVLARVLPAAVPRPALAPAPRAARSRRRLRGAALSLVVAGGAVLVAGRPSWPLAGVVAVVLVAGPLLGEVSYRALGWAEARGVHHARGGLLTRRTAIVPTARVQSAAVVSSWFQRRRGLASVRLDLAGAAVVVADREAGQARAIAADATTRTP